MPSSMRRAGGRPRSEALARLIVLGLGGAGVACDPVRYATFAVAPRSAVATDSAGHAALAIIARVAGRHGLRATAPTDATGRNDNGWDVCFTEATLFVCAKRTGPEVQFQTRQALRPRFTLWADTLRRALIDTLRAEFGARQVRACRRSDCPPAVPRDSAQRGLTGPNGA